MCAEGALCIFGFWVKAGMTTNESITPYTSLLSPLSSHLISYILIRYMASPLVLKVYSSSVLSRTTLML